MEFQTIYSMPYFFTSKNVSIMNTGDTLSNLVEKNYSELKEVNKEGITEEEIKIKEEHIKKESDKIQRVLYYYSMGSNNRGNSVYYWYTPNGIQIIKVPQSQLGDNVLGMAFTTQNVIMILDSLTGLEFEEVKRHELNHIFYPHLNEWHIRDKTRMELPWPARYH